MMCLRTLLYLFFIALSVSLIALEPEDIPIKPHLLNHKEYPKSRLAVCTMFKNEAEWLKEWIEYLLCVGVDHFYLYNNCSSDDYWSVLKPYVQKGIVELYDVPIDSTLYEVPGVAHLITQTTCYKHALSKAQQNNQNVWLMFIDTDEFPILGEGDDFNNYLEQHSSYAGVYLRWQIFGTSTIWKLGPNELMIEKLIYRAPSDDPGNFWGKCIIQPHLACGFSSVHHAQFSDPECDYYNPPIEECRINHYFVRTEEYLHQVKIPRLEQWRGFDCFEPNTVLNAAYIANSVLDDSMLRFVPKIKKKVFGNKRRLEIKKCR